MRRPAGSPADDPSGVSIDDEGDIHEAGPGRHIRKIRQPQAVRRGSVELSVHMIQRTGNRLVADRRAHRLAPDRSPKAHVPHQSGDRAASRVEALPPQLAPDLANAVDAEILLEYALDLDPQIGVAADPVGQTGGIGAPGKMGMIGRRGDRQDLADRLDPVGLPMIVDEGDHGLNRRSAPPGRNKPTPCEDFSFDWRSSRFSRSSAFKRSATSAGTPPRTPLSISAFLTHSLRDCAVQPIFVAIEVTVAHREDTAHARKPAERRVCALREKTGSSSCLPSLHLLKVRSLRQTRSGSPLPVRVGFAALFQPLLRRTYGRAFGPGIQRDSDCGGSVDSSPGVWARI